MESGYWIARVKILFSVTTRLCVFGHKIIMCESLFNQSSPHYWSNGRTRGETTTAELNPSTLLTRPDPTRPDPTRPSPGAVTRRWADQPSARVGWPGGLLARSQVPGRSGKSEMFRKVKAGTHGEGGRDESGVCSSGASRPGMS